MKSLALITLSLILAPALAVLSRGAARESWGLIALAGAMLALVVAGIRYLLGGSL